LAEERQRALVRRRDPADREPAILARQRAARRLERRAAHVDRDVARRLVDPGVEQMACLRRATRAELAERGRADDAPDLARLVREQRRLRPRRVILRLLGDALEELATARVVEIATVQPAWMVREAAHHRLGEGGGRLLRRVDPQLEARVALAAEAGVKVRPRHPAVSKAGSGLGQSPCRTPDRLPHLAERPARAAREDRVDAARPVALPARHDVDVDVGNGLPGRLAVVDADGRAGGAERLAYRPR